MEEVNREHIEQVAEELNPTPDAGWQKMEETVREVRQHGGEANHPSGQGDASDMGDQHVVSRSGDLTEPVGTDSDSY